MLICAAVIATSAPLAARDETAAVVPVAHEPGPNAFAETRTTLVPFDSAPFPYHGRVPDQEKPFLDVDQGGRKGRSSARGILFEDRTFSDRRVLMSIPRGFDPTRPVLLIVYLHGLESRLDRDVLERQQVPRQLEESGLNAVLVAPQFAVDAPDSSAGQFWEPNRFADFLAESAARLARLHGNPTTRRVFDNAPVVIVAHGGGAVPTAFALDVGGARRRIHGVILLDAQLAEEARLADWIADRGTAFFVSTYSSGTQVENARLQKALAGRGLRVDTRMPDGLARGQIVFHFAGPGANARDFVTKAWTPDPLRALFDRIPGYARRGADAAVVTTASDAVGAPSFRHGGAEFKPVATETLLNWLNRPPGGTGRAPFEGPVPRAKPR